MTPRSQQGQVAGGKVVFAVKLPTALGVFVAEFTEQGLRRLHFPGRHGRQAQTHQVLPPSIQRLMSKTQAALEVAVRGRKPARLPALDWSGATSFQQKVWRALLEVAPGDARSYGELARRIRRPGAARAVGAACGANPIPVLVPCHRVLGAGGRLGGFSGGLDWKRRLLAIEGFEALER